MSKKNTDAKASKTKKAVNIALIVLQIAIVVVAIAFSISILLSTGYESNTDFGDSSIRLMPVLTDSMNGDKDDSFAAGDLIIVKKATEKDKAELKVGDIVTYLDYVGADLQFVTHRVVSVEETELTNGSVVKVIETMGDAETSGITKTLYSGDIQGIYLGKLAGVGKAVFWLQDPTHFFLVIMLPLILLLLYNAYLVVRIIIEAKLKKQREQLAAESASGVTPLDEEEIKRRAIEEYLRSQNAQQASEKPETAQETAPGTTTETAPVTAQPDVSEEQVSENETGTPAEALNPDEKKEAEPAENAVQSAEEPQNGDVVEETESTESVTIEVVAPTEEPVSAEGTAPAEEISGVPEEQSAPEAENAEASEEKAEEKPAEKVKKPAAKKTVKKSATTDKTAEKKPAKKSAATGKTAEKKTAAKKTETKPAAGKPATSAAKAKTGTGKKASE